MLMNYVASNPQFKVEWNKVRWVTMHEKTMMGLDPMRLSQLVPVPRIEETYGNLPQEPSWLQTAWANFLGTVQPTSTPNGPEGHKVLDVEFLPLSHQELEEMINFRFFWDC